MSTVRILQHNCARSTNVIYSLLNTAEKDVDIIIIQESWLSRDGNTISHASFHSYIANNEERARTAIYISNIHKHFTANIRNDILDDGDVQIIDIHISNKIFRLYNIYNERRDNRYTSDRILRTHSFENDAKIILAGDFNAHHTWWNADIENSNPRDERLVQTLQENQFELLNEADTYTHVYKHNDEVRTSVIDLTFANENAKPYISNWAVDHEQHTGSNHMLIRFDIETDENNTMLDPTADKYNFKKTDWKVFAETFTKDNFELTWCQDERDKRTLEDMAVSLRNSIQNAVEQSTPRLRMCVRSKA